MDELIGSDTSQGELEKLCNKLSEDWTTFAQLPIPCYTTNVVSSAMQLINGQYLPISEYFLHVAHKRCKNKLTASVRAAADRSNTPALKGWAFELEQLDVIEKAIHTPSRIIESEDGTFSLPLTSGDMVTYDGSTMGNITGEAFTIDCVKWNQGCFDVAFYVKPDLYTVSFTVSESLSFKVTLLRDLKDALEKSNATVSRVTHVAVVKEKDKCDVFAFGSAEGVGKTAETIEFQVRLALQIPLRPPTRKHRTTGRLLKLFLFILGNGRLHAPKGRDLEIRRS